MTGNKSVINLSCPPDFKFFNEKRKDLDDFWHGKLTFEVRILWSSGPDSFICQRPFNVRKCLFPFNQPRVWCEVAEKFLNGIELVN